MREQIWKFQIPVMVPATIGIKMPIGAKILTVQMQNETANIWAICDPLAVKERREFSIVATGQPFNFSDHQYIGTFQKDGGQYVFHLFEFTI
jgi:hypothetical protein